VDPGDKLTLPASRSLRFLPRPGSPPLFGLVERVGDEPKRRGGEWGVSRMQGHIICLCYRIIFLIDCVKPFNSGVTLDSGFQSFAPIGFQFTGCNCFADL